MRPERQHPKMLQSSQMRTSRGGFCLLLIWLIFDPSSVLGAPMKLVQDLPTFLLDQSALVERSSSLFVSNFYSNGNHNNNDDDQDEPDSPEWSSAKSTPLVEYELNELLQNSNNNLSLEANQNDSSNLASLLSAAGIRKSLSRLPNGQSFQYCEEKSNFKCNDENAICTLSACICKSGYFSDRQSGLCKSISDLLKNCENDHQCQAFNVDLVCDNKLHERPVCDCVQGLYFDQETHNCLPCHRNTIILSKFKLTNSTSLELEEFTDSGPELSNKSSSANESTLVSPKQAQHLRVCKPLEISKLSMRRRQQLNNFGLPTSLSPFRGGQLVGGNSNANLANPNLSGSAGSDPLRIKVPLEVFMGAIMLFTLFTVAWFFLQRMTHDCRAILRSLRSNDLSQASAAEHHQQFSTSSGLGRTINYQHYFDPHTQAVTRLFSADHYNGAFGGQFSSAGIYQPDLAGVMVQHLAANLSPSTTSSALVASHQARTLSPGFGLADQDAAAGLYPQSRSAAMAAAAQLILSPPHPAIALLRAAAATAAQNPNSPDYATANLLSSMFDPPPKYEEAVTQANQVPYEVSARDEQAPESLSSHELVADQQDSQENPDDTNNESQPSRESNSGNKSDPEESNALSSSISVEANLGSAAAAVAGTAQDSLESSSSADPQTQQSPADLGHYLGSSSGSSARQAPRRARRTKGSTSRNPKHSALNNVQQNKHP